MQSLHPDQLQVLDALSSSLDLRVVLERVYPLILRAVSADSGALAVFRDQSPGSADWFVSNLPASFFAAYAQMAEHDFVRESVAARPNVPLIDDEMVERRAFERNALYQYGREVGARIEKVMAVMLPSGAGVRSGLALYRDRRRAFGGRERRLLAGITGALANAVRNCVAHEEVLRRGLMFELGTDQQLALALVLVSSSGRELERTHSVTRLFESWFTPAERLGPGLPDPLAEAMALAASCHGSAPACPARWERRAGESVLVASFLPAPEELRGCWLLTLNIQSRPKWCETLTPRERQVLELLRNAYDNELIAEQLSCAVETVKKHVSSILEKSGKESRLALLAVKIDP